MKTMKAMKSMKAMKKAVDEEVPAMKKAMKAMKAGACLKNGSLKSIKRIFQPLKIKGWNLKLTQLKRKII